MKLIKIVADDIFDPRLWEEDDHEHRIYADETLEHYAIVDAWLYPLLVKYKWSIHNQKLRHRRGVFYLRRSITEFWGPDGEKYESPITGKLVRNRKRRTSTRFLHTDVLLLAGIDPPTPDHKEVDHKNRRTADCRLDNLKWATREEQVANSDYDENMRRARAARFNGNRKSGTDVLSG